MGTSFALNEPLRDNLQEMLINILNSVKDEPIERMYWATDLSIDDSVKFGMPYCKKCTIGLKMFRGPHYIEWGGFCLSCHKLIGYYSPNLKNPYLKIHNMEFAAGRLYELQRFKLEINRNTKPVYQDILKVSYKDIKVIKRLCKLAVWNFPWELIL